MYNIIKVHPQDRVRREGSFNQFSVDLPGVNAEDREREHSLEGGTQDFPKETARPSPQPGHLASHLAIPSSPAAPSLQSHSPSHHLVTVSHEQPGYLGEPQQPRFTHLPQLAKLQIPQPEHAEHVAQEPLRAMEPSMQISPDVPSHFPAFTRPRSLLSPMHAALPPLQTRFSTGSMRPSPVSPSPLTTCSPPISPVYAGSGTGSGADSGGYYSYPNTPVSPTYRP